MPYYLHNIQDYYNERDRVKQLVLNSKTRKERKAWYKRLTRLLKEIQTYEKFKGVYNDKPHRIFDNR